MELLFSKRSWDEYQYWLQSDKKLARKINSLLKEVQRTPYEGTGNPEPLKHSLSGCWSRRITGEHRLVYKIMDNNTAYIMQCKSHY